MDCLIIKQEPLNKILQGEKTWELRGTKTHKRGRIGLIQSGSGLIVGECEVVGCTTELSQTEFAQHKDKHCSKSTTKPYSKTYAWKIQNAKKYDDPIPYSHPKGAIIWVKVTLSERLCSKWFRRNCIFLH